ncbi:anti-sigma factor [Phaeobacter piscinae]|nr:anti-sigma factor [Phaeobacter piscinae]ATG41846.1 putative anti-sigmaE protein [Phaeobacter piscinae]ATG41946.1 putative anti-sigmaE protein [Phaeobacter piscinae]ATG41961.1 putative anti-sigmaE protein [Phaeobacter piscinae]
MSSAQTYNPDDDVLAAEYALHLLSPTERASFKERLRDDAALRDLVRGWEEHFFVFSDEVAEVAPPKRAKSAIDRRLFGPELTSRSTIWAWLLGTGGIAAVAFAVALFVMPFLQDPLQINPTHTAEVATEDRSLVIVAAFSAVSNALVVRRTQGSPATGRVHEMWLILEGATAPISLGLIPEGNEGRIAIPQELAGRLTAALFAVSDEPTGGSPTGQPTGAVLAAGPIQAL